MKRLNLMPTPDEMDTEKDTIFMEDPNASRGPMPPQVDFPRMNPNMSSEELEKLLKDYSQVQFPVRTEAPPAINNFDNILNLLNATKSTQAPRTEGTSTLKPAPSRSIEDITPTIRPTPSVSEDNTPFINFPLTEEKPAAPTQMDMLEKLLKAREGAGNMNLALRAGMMANEAIAQSRGAKVPTNEGALKALEQQAQQPLESFATQVKSKDVLEMQDPDSDISKIMRTKFIDMLKRDNPNIDTKSFERLTASQLKELGFAKDDELRRLSLDLQRQRLELQRQAEEGKGERFYDRLDLSKEQFENKKLEQDRIPQEAAKVLTGADTTLAALKDLRKYKPLFNTGPVKNRVEEFKRLFGKEEPDFAGFKSRIAATLSAYVKSMSGTAASDKEVERLDDVIPKASDSDESFITKLNSFEDQVKTSKKAIMDSYKKLDYDLRGYEKDYEQLSTPKKSEKTKKDDGSSKFPRQVRNAKTGEVATVSNAEELAEAQSEGFN